MASHLLKPPDKIGVILPQSHTLTSLSLLCFTLFINLSRRVQKGYYRELPSHTEHKCAHHQKHLHGWRQPGQLRIPAALGKQPFSLCCSHILLVKETKTEGGGCDQGPCNSRSNSMLLVRGDIHLACVYMNVSQVCVSEGCKEVGTSLNPLLHRNTCDCPCLIYHLPDSEDRPEQSSGWPRKLSCSLPAISDTQKANEGPYLCC